MSDTTTNALRSAIGAIELATKWVRDGDRNSRALAVGLLDETAAIMRNAVNILDAIEAKYAKGKETNEVRSSEV